MNQDKLIQQLKEFCLEELNEFSYQDSNHKREVDYELCKGRAEMAESILSLMENNDG